MGIAGHRDVFQARRLLHTAQPTPEAGAWSLAGLAGRFAELTGGPAAATFTLAAGLVLEAQRGGRLAAWVGGWDASFYPPDLRDCGVDLDALPVIRTETPLQAARAAETLVRSGSFALVVLGLRRLSLLPLPVQGRLVGLAHHHGTTLLALTRDEGARGPRSSLVSFRAEAAHRRIGADCFACELTVLKDKRGAAGWTHREIRRGPGGLC